MAILGRTDSLFKHFLIGVLLLSTVAVSAVARAYTVLVWGDSLSAAYGMSRDDGWVELLQGHVADAGIEVVNLSVSGETTAGGLRRLPDALATVEPDLVVLELGANDGLRGFDVSITRENLAQMVGMSQRAGARVLLLGMQIPPNYGPDYAAAFAAVFAEVATAAGAELVPFFLEPVALDWDMMQSDGIHPTAAAQPTILSHLWPHLAPLLPASLPAPTG